MASAGSSTHTKAKAAYDAQQGGSGSIPGSALAAGAVDTAQLADGAVEMEKVGAGETAAQGSVDHAGADLVLVTAPTGVYLSGTCAVRCTEAIVDGGGGAPTFSAGDGTDVDAFAVTGSYAAFDALNDVFAFGFRLEPGQALTITPTDGTGGDAGTFQHYCTFGPVADWT